MTEKQDGQKQYLPEGGYLLGCCSMYVVETDQYQLPFHVNKIPAYKNQKGTEFTRWRIVFNPVIVIFGYQRTHSVFHPYCCLSLYILCM
jgi:hypothetical protein